MLDPRKTEEYKRYFAEFNTLLKGELDAEYARVKELCLEWDKRTNLNEAQRLLKQAQEDHEAVVAKFEKMSNKYTADMKAWHANLTAKENDLIKREQALTAKGYEVTNAQAKHDADVAAHAATKAAADKAFAQRAADLDNLQKALHEREVALNAKQAKLDTALQHLAAVKG